MTRSEQLPFARVTSFSRTSLVLKRFWSEFENLLNSTKPVRKTCRAKNGILYLLAPFYVISYTSNALIDKVEILKCD